MVHVAMVEFAGYCDAALKMSCVSLGHGHCMCVRKLTTLGPPFALQVPRGMFSLGHSCLKQCGLAALRRFWEAETWDCSCCSSGPGTLRVALGC